MTNHQLCQFIVKSFVEPLTSRDWPREIKIAKGLIINNPDENFWIRLNKPFKLPSLAWFLTEKGKKFLIEQKNILDLDLVKQDNIQLNDEKVGEDLDFKPDKKTLMEFLRNK